MVQPHDFLPGGWNALRYEECVCGEDGVVLAERTRDDANHGTRYVTYRVDIKRKSSYLGHYTDDFKEATADFEDRARSMI